MPPSSPRPTDRWAPWWAYLALILGANYVRQWVLPYGSVAEPLDVLLALTLAGLIFVGITAAYRAWPR